MLETETSFGTWLRHQRRQLDLTQTALAARIGYSVVTIRKLERDELRPSKQLAERLAQFLEPTPEQQAGVVAFARTGVAPTAPANGLSIPGRISPTPLPQLTPLIGRTAELNELAHRLHDPACRLLTIVGPGGMGKSRLALAAAQQLLDGGQTQVCFVPLVALPADASLAAAIMLTLGYPIQPNGRSLAQQLIDYLRPQQMLLVLDNFEHLLESAGLISALLQAVPGLRVLVTSRERLQLSTETVLTLGGMAYPPQATRDNARTYSAVQLFAQSARRVRLDFTLDAATITEVVHICQLVAGMPLAIVLAAAWVDLLSPQEIRQEISQNLDFLESQWRDIPERQRSIRAVFAHTWGRLSISERAVFMRLAVFRGGFTRQAAQRLAEASLRTLSTLVNKSLVQCDASGRYTIHELLRQYAAAELETAGQTADACAAHGTYYTDFLQQREADLKGRRQVAALDEIEADFENVRAAWQWAVAQRDYPAIDRALEALYWFCEMRSRFHEGLELLRSGREQLAPLAGEAPHPVWGRLMARVLGQDFRWFDQPTEFRARIEIGLTIAQANDNRAEVAFCLWGLAMAMLLGEDAGGAIAYFEQSIVHYRALADRFYLACLYRSLGLLYTALDQSAKGNQLIVQSVESCRDTGDLNGLTQSLAIVGWFLYHNGRYTEAETHWREARELCFEIGARYALVPVQMGFTWLAIFARGDFGAAHVLAEELRSLVSDITDAQARHRSMLIVFGFLAGMGEDYHTCHHSFQQALAQNFPYLPFTTSWELMGMCLAAYGLDDTPDTGQHLQQVLDISLKNEWPANAAKALTFAAILFAQTGKPERATELLGLVFYHPLSPKGWLAQWPLITRLRTELTVTLPPERFAAAWARGARMDLMTTAETVMAELATTNGADAPESV